jgi:hypothetical protein
MAGKKGDEAATSTGKAKVAEKQERGSPRYPYTSYPNLLRRILTEIPKRPKPPKLDKALLSSWGIGDNNAGSAVKVLIKIGLLDTNAAPNEKYEAFMGSAGGATLSSLVKSAYPELFAAEHRPYKDDATVRHLFNVHGGTTSENTLKPLRETFKVLCEFGDFDSVLTDGGTGNDEESHHGVGGGGGTGTGSRRAATFEIHVHIHLPEGRSSRDYEHMLEDIGRFILDKEHGKE